MNLSLSMQDFNRYSQRLPVSTLRKVLNLVLVLLLAWLLARLSWQLVPVPELASSGPLQQAALKTTGQATTYLDQLLSYPLFGKVIAEPEQAAPVVTEAPKTQLNVKLTGVVAQADPNSGSAIIESRGSEGTYAIDDTIDGTNAVLKQVLIDRVLIQQAGRFETLMLDGIEYTKMAQANAGLGREDNPEPAYENELVALPQAEAPALDESDLGISRDELLAEPMKFFDYVRVSPQHRNGELVGYRLMPGKDPALFNQLGLQQNDLAVEINGIPLNDMQQAMRVINELRDATEAAIKIERDGETRDILFSLSQ
ncbi:type II secretion system protein C (GspC) [Arsukibacterium tuosuense]|uniref:Type II secretion system protein C (GspC) n=1 Tax=Arsukibacterium tuosuense TaxID=1323745 RepID=A0A285JHR8_9GAMM|nr:type II secretion system protein GspC [Arsukibacterium tuosuense]SNY59357.1 type II secretion system protein C (GspC) [Arsukibacterium tuosuense]